MLLNPELLPNLRYGIMLSGGLDSAVLFYLILADAKSKNIELNIQPFTIPKTDGSYLYVEDILNYFGDQFNILIPDTIHVGDPSAHHTLQSKTAVIEILEKHPHIDCLYFATNQNPTHSFDYSKYPPGCFPNRVKGSTDPKIQMPFIDMYKDEILKFVFDNSQEELLFLTHTCTEQKTGRCGQCFQCNERQWAFDQLGKIDPGVN
jgi:hypothetical protein